MNEPIKREDFGFKPEGENFKVIPVACIGGRREWRRLPKGVRRQVQEVGIARLRLIWGQVSKESRVERAPIIRVRPICWVPPDFSAAVLGRCTPLSLRVGNSLSMWGVELPAAIVLAVEDDSLLRRLVVHEMAHCFHYYQGGLNASSRGASKIERRALLRSRRRMVR